MKSPPQLEAIERHIETPAILRSIMEKAIFVLERPPFGGGGVNWFRVTSREDFPRLIHELTAGSVVTFVLDDSLKSLVNRDAIIERVVEVTAAYHGAALLVYRVDALEVAGHAASSAEDVDFALQDAAEDARFAVGPYPGRVNDEVRAVTFTVADADGLERAYPH